MNLTNPNAFRAGERLSPSGMVNAESAPVRVLEVDASATEANSDGHPTVAGRVLDDTERRCEVSSQPAVHGKPPAGVKSAVPSQGQLWGIVLAGGEGVRLRALVRRVCADDRPKQYVPLFGDRTLLQQTLDRVALGIPPNRTAVAPCMALWLHRLQRGRSMVVVCKEEGTP